MAGKTAAILDYENRVWQNRKVEGAWVLDDFMEP